MKSAYEFTAKTTSCLSVTTIKPVISQDLGGSIAQAVQVPPLCRIFRRQFGQNYESKKDNNSNLLIFLRNRRKMNTYKTSQRRTRVKKKTENGLEYL